MRNRAIHVIITLIACLPSMLWAASVTTDFETAKSTAIQEGKDLFLEFTGSDWCPPCKALKLKVLDTDAFRAEAPRSFVFVVVDFPNDKSKQSDAEIAQNKALQKQFDVSAYPAIVLTDAAGRAYARLVGYQGATPEEYLKRLAELRQVRVMRDAAFAEAAKASGLEQAKLLDKGLRGIDGELLSSVYMKEVQRIIAADADGKAGLKEKYEPLVMVPRVAAALEQIKLESGDTESRLKKIDELVAKLKPAGAALQQVHYTKAILLYVAGQKEAARPHFEAAIQAAPRTRKADEVRTILAKHFNSDKGTK